MTQPVSIPCSESKLYYIISPYSYPEYAVRERRFKQMQRLVYKLEQKYAPNVFISPILIYHPMVEDMVDGDATPSAQDDYWYGCAINWLAASDRVLLHLTPGLETSVGCRKELVWCLGRRSVSLLYSDGGIVYDIIRPTTD